MEIEKIKQMIKEAFERAKKERKEKRMKLNEMCSREKGWFHLLYENNEYISIKIGQYTHTRNYDLDDLSHNKNLMTDTLEIMGVGENICSVFGKKKYEEWSEDCGENHILMSWFPAEKLPTLLKEIDNKIIAE